MKYFLLLTVCSIAAFIAVLRMRPEILSGTYSSASTTTTVAPVPTVPEKKSTNAAVRSRSTRAEREVEASTAASLPEQLAKATQQSSNPRARRLARATVTADTLPVYVTNSPTSRVLKVLNKGDQVQTDLAVIDSVGHWSLITVPGQRISGYVRTEDIDLTRTASED